MGLNVTYLQFAVGDVKPIVFSGVVASTNVPITSASAVLVDHLNAGAIINGSVPMTINGSMIQTSLIPWNTVGTFILQVRVGFNDGTVDNTLIAQITVNPLPS